MFGYVVLNFISSNIDSNISNSSTVHTKDVCMFQRKEPSVSIYLIYGLVVPTLASFGLCANVINFVVFMRPKMTPSAFTYLAALSMLDCISCLLITLTALSRSYFYKRAAWIAYDYQWQTPLFGISTGAANLILACLSLDRFIYLLKCESNNGAPKFCRRNMARFMICVVTFISVLANLPYFFSFFVDLDTATCHVTDFYYTKFYQIHNWFSFGLLALIPAIFLLIGNTAIIIVFRRWTKQGVKCHQNCRNDNLRTTSKRYQHQVKLTISILIVITLYMVGELPAHMTSRKSSMNLLFGGDLDKMNPELMEQLEVIFITLNALQLSMNIVVYAVINPSFMPEFFLCLRGASDFCFQFCCLPHMARGCKSCWSWVRKRHGPHAEELVVSCVETPHLPPDEVPPHWSIDSGCIDGGAQCTTADEYFEECRSELESEPQVFITKASGCMQQTVNQTFIDENDDAYLSSFVM